MTWPDPGAELALPRVLTGRAAGDVLARLARAGDLTRRPPERPGDAGGWAVTAPGREGGTRHPDGRRYLAVEVPGMLPLYRELYGRIFARRLALWGLRADGDTGVLAEANLIVAWGPDEEMRARSPARIARERVEVGDDAWVEALEERWAGAASACEAALDRLWAALRRGHVRPALLEEAATRKVEFATWAVDALIPPRPALEDGYGAVLGPGAARVLGASLLPASGFVAYDLLERACWRLAADSAPGGVGGEARRQFVQHGLFYLYRALEPARWAYFLGPYVEETAARYRAAAPGPGEAGRNLADLGALPWRRRLHHAWAREQLAALPEGPARARLLTLHRLLGTARDFDEEKRRLNMPLWRSLVALARGLGLSLDDEAATLGGLCRALEERGGRVEIDPVFR